jgi:hypothetical protein
MQGRGGRRDGFAIARLQQHAQQRFSPSRAASTQNDRQSCVAPRLHERPSQAVPHLIDRLSRVVERSDPGGLQAIVTAWAAGANRCASAEPRGEECLAFESFLRRVHRAGCHVALKARLHFLENRTPIRLSRRRTTASSTACSKAPKDVGHVTDIVGFIAA